MKRFLVSIVGLSLVVAALGCKPKTPDGLPDLQKVNLTVIQDGKPLAEATVMLKSLDSTNTWTSGGTTDANGVATLVTHGQYQGVPIGKYKVAVSKTIGEGTPPPPTPIDAESARKYDEYMKSGLKWEEFNVVDPQLGVVETTTLEIEVVKGTNDLSVDVGGAVKIPYDSGRSVVKPNY